MSKDALIKCADAGVAECQFQLGELTENGRSVVKDTAVAKQLYELAYKNGYEPAGSAVLRLTRDQATPSTAPVAQPIPARAVSTPRSEVTTSPSSWHIEATNHSAPSVAEVKLYDSEEGFLSRINNGSCKAQKSRPPTRTCEGTLANGALDVSADFLDGQLYVMSFMATVSPAVCEELSTAVVSAIGPTNHGFRSKLLSMAIPGAAKYWSTTEWSVVSGCLDHKGALSDAMLFVMDNAAGEKVKN